MHRGDDLGAPDRIERADIGMQGGAQRLRLLGRGRAGRQHEGGRNACEQWCARRSRFKHRGLLVGGGLAIMERETGIVLGPLKTVNSFTVEPVRSARTGWQEQA
ncbi:hypothetical protein STVA_41010 [Allostella vacuolata]|nr:hypothetical protein STVA_41010 [Stella vacuolata]